MNNDDHRMTKVRNGETKVNKVKKEIDALERRLKDRLQELRDDIEDIQTARLVSAKRAAEILDISIDAVRKRADNGTLTKRNSDGSKKLTNRRTPVFFDEQEVRGRI